MALQAATRSGRIEIVNEQGGMLSATSADSLAVSVVGGSQDGTAPNLFINRGAVNGDVVFQAYPGEDPSAYHHRLENHAEIDGDVFFNDDGDDYFVAMPGSVFDAGNSIYFNDGDDTLELRRGARFSGTAIFNDGDNTLKLERDAHFSGIAMFNDGDNTLELERDAHFSGTAIFNDEGNTLELKRDTHFSGIVMFNDGDDTLELRRGARFLGALPWEVRARIHY